jgi:hypothetical protein
MNEARTFRRPSWLWLLLVVAIFMGLTGLLLFYLNRNTPVPISWAAAGGPRNGPMEWFNSIQQALIAPILAGVFGILILQTRPKHRIGWLLIGLGLISAAAGLTQEWAVLGAFTSPGSAPGWFLAAWVTNWIWVILMAFVLLMLALFPAGQFLNRRWKALILTSLFLFLGPGLIATAIETPMTSAFQIPNPFVKVHRAGSYDFFFNNAIAFLPITAIAALASMLVRFRRGEGHEREQIKWLLIGVALFALLMILGLALSISAGSLIGNTMLNAAYLGPLLGVGIAMLRHQLYDVDFIIRRTTAYAILTALLALIYFASIVVLQQLLTPIVGDSDVAVVLSTLLIAVLFLPLRRRVQDALDRRFFRRKYDAEKTLAAFAATVRNETDLDALTAELVRVIQETMQPEFVSVWLRQPAATDYGRLNDPTRMNAEKANDPG